MNRHRQNPESVAIQRIDSGKRRSEDRAREAQVLAHARVATVVAIMAVPAMLSIGWRSWCGLQTVRTHKSAGPIMFGHQMMALQVRTSATP